MNYEIELRKMRQEYDFKRYKTKKFKAPFWLQKTDSLYALYEEYGQLFERGRVYYGYVYRANGSLFSKFPPIDHLALVFYCTNPMLEAEPFEVGKVAGEIAKYSYKQPQEVPEEYREAAEIFRDEMARKDVMIPYTLIDGTKVLIRMKTMIITKKFLPNGKLSESESVMPILALPGELKSEVVLPHTYWTEEMKAEW